MLIKNNIQYLISPLLNATSADVCHGFLSRTGGVSAHPFASLNFDRRDGDPIENIERNKDVAGRACNAPFDRLVTVNQVHGSDVVRLDVRALRAAVRPLNADAIITKLANIPIGMLTADCLPILLFDPVNMAIGAAHAGWRGTAGRIAVAVVEAMTDEFGSRPEDVIAALGPHIRGCCYTVNADVRASFTDAHGQASDYFIKDSRGLRLDLGAANVHQLLSSGLSKNNISATAPCTSCHNDLFFSYRKENGMTGRQLSFIMLR